MQLTPLPRVILEFERGRKARGEAGRPPRWQPAGARTAPSHGAMPLAISYSPASTTSEPLPSPSLRSGSHPAAPQQQQAACGCGSVSSGASPFAAAAPGTAAEIEPACAVVVDGRELSGVRTAPCEATSSLGTDDLPADCGAALTAVVSETHLLQFGAMLGEGSCREALALAEAVGPVGSTSGSLYGSPDTDAFYGPWEQVVHETAAGLMYWGWRRPLRRGLYMYMTRSVFLGVSPGELRAFMMDDACRVRWDRSMAALGPALAPARGARAPQQRESDVLLAAVKFPKPLAQRSYAYARRVWARPCDGGCYVLARACAPPAGGAAPPKGVAVTDYCSGAVIRAPAPALLGGHAGPAAEVLMIYFEDSHVRAGFANLGIKKGLWPMLQRTDRALRSYLMVGSMASCAGSVPSTPRGSCFTAPQTPAVAGASKGTGGASGAARAFGGFLLRSLRTLASAAGALWEAHARVASLLPRMELRVLRWLLARVVNGSGAAFGRLPGSQLASGASRAPPRSACTSRLHRVNSHPLNDCFAPTPIAAAAPAQQPSPQPAAAAPSPPTTKLTVRVAGPAPAVAPAAAGCSAGAPGLVRVGSHPLTAEDMSALDTLESPENLGSKGGAATSLVTARSAPVPTRQRSSSSSGGMFRVADTDSDEPCALGSEWPVARFVAAAFEPQGQLRGSYPASCPTGSCAGSEASCPVSVGSCKPPSGRGQRRRAGGRLVVRLMQAASVRLAHKLLSSLDQQQQ